MTVQKLALAFLTLFMFNNSYVEACAPGSLTEVTGSPFGTSSGVASVSFTYRQDQGDFLSAGQTGTVQTFTNTNGVLSAPTSITANQASAIAYSPTSALAVVTDFGNNTVTSYLAAPLTGVLSNPQTVSTGAGSGPFGVSFSADGNFIVVSNTTTGTLAVYSVSPSGLLTQVATIAATAGVQNAVMRGSFAAPYFIATASATGVHVYNFNGVSTITEIAGSPFSAGTAFSSVAYSPDGLFLAATSNTGTGTIFSVNQITGALTASSTFVSGTSSNALHYSHNGLFAAFTNSSTSQIYVYNVNTTTGAFTAATGSPFATSAVNANSLSFSNTDTVLAVGSPLFGAVATYTIQAAAPQVTITANQTSVCDNINLAITLTANVAPGTGTAPFSYSWTGPNGFTSTSNPAVLPAPTQVAYSGSYTVTVTDANGCIANASQTITVNPRPTISINAPTTQTVCVGSTVSFTAQGADGTAPYTYSWTKSGSQISTSQTLTLTNVQTSDAGTYTVGVQDANGCPNSGANATATLIVNANPTAAISPTAQTACVTSSVTFDSQVTGGITPYTYAWTGPNSFSATTPSITLSNLQLVNAGTYTLIVTDANGCTSTPQTGTLTVNALPVAAATPTSQTICGGTAIFTASGGTSYAWTGPNGFTATTASITVSDSGIYTVTVSTDGIGCSDTAQVTLVNTGPVITINPANATICLGGTATFSAAVTGGTSPYTYSWSDESGFISDQPSISLTPTTIGTQTLTVSVTDANGCSNIQNATLIVNAIPTVSVTASATSITAGQTVTLTSTPTAIAPYELRWSDGVIQTGLTGISTRTVNPLVSTQYSVVIVDATGCESDPIIAADITVNSTLSALAFAIRAKYC